MSCLWLSEKMYTQCSQIKSSHSAFTYNIILVDVRLYSSRYTRQKKKNRVYILYCTYLIRNDWWKFARISFWCVFSFSVRRKFIYFKLCDCVCGIFVEFFFYCFTFEKKNEKKKTFWWNVRVDCLKQYNLSRLIYRMWSFIA